MMNKIQELALAMINYDNGDPKRIQHTTKLHAYASLIGIGEGFRATHDKDGIRKLLGFTDKQLPIMNNPVGYEKK